MKIHEITVSISGSRQQDRYTNKLRLLEVTTHRTILWAIFHVDHTYSKQSPLNVSGRKPLELVRQYIYRLEGWMLLLATKQHCQSTWRRI